MTGATRAAFVERLGFTLDGFQVEAMDAIDAGSSVLVAAPTGAGKTVVGEYAVARALAEGAKAFYTTPLKALSNQKYADLCRVHGAADVGLLTGDNSIRGDAPVVVMTTEVLRNMLYARSATLLGLRYVVLDEVHYLENAWRGPVWEEVIIHAPADIQLICLSATVSNAEEVAEWLATVRGSAAGVIEEGRPVELTHLYMVVERGDPEPRVLQTFVDGRPNPEGGEYDGALAKRKGRGGPRGRWVTPRRLEVLDALEHRGMLPAIYFLFSRAGCNDAVRTCRSAGVALTSPEERAEIRRIAEEKVAPLSEGDLRVLGYDDWLAALECGTAAHHAGMVPAFKEAVEACFVRGLVKIVFATETLALGINMPARTVVIERLTKFTGERHEALRPGEYTQLTGRAGRRGIDTIGYAVVLWSPFVAFEDVAGLASKRTYPLTSAFRPTYNMAANLVRRYTPAQAHRLLNLSFAQFRADRQIVELEAQVAQLRAEAARAHRSGRRGTTLSERIGADADRLERTIDRRASTLARQFDGVLRLLEARRYVAGWRLTPSGERLARIAHDQDLLVVEALDEGLLGGLEPAETAGLASAFVYEPRGPDEPQAQFPSPALRSRWHALAALSARLEAEETRAHLVVTRPPDPGFIAFAHGWASGGDLGKLLTGTELAPGDFVRVVKQLIDLLRQLADVAAAPDTARTCRLAADAVMRGVVVASSTVDGA